VTDEEDITWLAARLQLVERKLQKFEFQHSSNEDEGDPELVELSSCLSKMM
jgi:hypothetical protein